MENKNPYVNQVGNRLKITAAYEYLQVLTNELLLNIVKLRIPNSKMFQILDLCSDFEQDKLSVWTEQIQIFP